MRLIENIRKKRLIFAIISAVLLVAVVWLIFALSGSFGKSKATNAADVTTSSQSGTVAKETALLRDSRFFSAYISYGKDYHMTGKESVTDDKTLIGTEIDKLSEYGVNSLFVPVYYNDKAIFNDGATAKYSSENDLLQGIISKAKTKNIKVYTVFSAVIASEDITTATGVGSSVSRLKALLDNYKIDGVLVNDYYFSPSENSYTAYLSSSGYGDFAAYKRACTRALLSKISAEIKAKSIYCGLFADAVYKADSGIAADKAAFTAYDDGFCDTYQILSENMFDFALINTVNPVSNKTAGFEAVSKWWTDKLQKSKTDLCFMLANSKVGSGYAADELVKQLQLLSKQNADNIAGFAFDSSYSLINDKTGCTDITLKYLNEKLKSDVKFSELKVISPKTESVSTYEGTVSIAGSCDVNFPLYINNKQIKPDANGYFTAKYSLKIGENVFKISSKGKTLTYKVNYKVILIKQVTPSGSISVDGGSEVAFGAVGRKGAKLWLTLGDQTILMNENDDSTSNDSQFAKYYVSMTLPEAESRSYSLGKIKVTAEYSGISEVKYGGNVTIKSQSSNTVSTVISSGSSKLLDTTNVVTAGTKYIAQIAVDQAEMMKGNVTDDRSRPVYSFLPKGTLDYCAAKEILNFEYDNKVVKYRQLNSGCRVYSDADHVGQIVNVLKGSLPSTNTVIAQSCNISDRHTVMSFAVGWKAPFLMQLNPQQYSNPNSTTPSYAISSATYTHLDITFYYANSAQGKFDLSDNPVFSSMEWIKSGKNYILRLNLRKTGTIYGYTASFTTDGKLIFKFLNPSAVSAADNDYGYSLAGKVIMLDAGHGGDDPGAMGYNSSNYEAKLNLMLAKAVKTQLEKTGATVYLTRSCDSSVDLVERTAMMRTRMPDVFISIHRDSSGDSSQHGFDSYYYYPFSKKLATSIFNSATTVLSPRKVNYYPFFVARVTECPSILTENGFVSNPSEQANLANTGYNAKQAKAFTQGIVNYFASIK